MGGGGGGGGQNALVGMAMGQASKLFDQQSSQGRLVCPRFHFDIRFAFMIAFANKGCVPQDPSANEESAVQKAGEMALKMYMGGGGGGGAGGLMSLASKFM